MSYRDIPKITNRRVNTTFNQNQAVNAIEQSSVTPAESSRTTRGTFIRQRRITASAGLPQIYVVVKGQYRGVEADGQNPDFFYVDLKPLKLDGTTGEPKTTVRAIEIPDNLDGVD